MFALQVLMWIVVSCALMSFIEHQVHSKLMHKKSVARFQRTFEAHAIDHHGHYSNIFSDEPVPPGEDKEIRLTVRKAPFKALLVALPLSLISFMGAAIFVAVVTVHHWVWNKIHLEMHKPENRGFSSWRIYKFLARYHWLHHKYPNKNFNVVFPFADYVLGTCAVANASDHDAMRRIGL